LVALVDDTVALVNGYDPTKYSEIETFTPTDWS
jgi:hypothetical protein